MLRTSFCTNIMTDEVTCDIQYGNILRSTHENTSWDMAKYEICAHKYVDLSDCSHGATLLSDCKYGYRVKDGMMDMNLLRGSEYPGEQADRAEHTFRYAFYPHRGDVAHSDVIHKSYEFNIPLRIGGSVDSFLTVDNTDIIVESVKKCEDRDSVIVRLYESKGAPAKTKLTFGRPVKEAYLVDMMEEDRQEVNLDELTFHGFEILSLEVLLG